MKIAAGPFSRLPDLHGHIICYWGPNGTPSYDGITFPHNGGVVVFIYNRELYEVDVRHEFYGKVFGIRFVDRRGRKFWVFCAHIDLTDDERNDMMAIIMYLDSPVYIVDKETDVDDTAMLLDNLTL